ncbi:MAG: hypothetical protein ACYDAC_11355 [Candidatus Dormibacteria bacterium]
MPRPATRRPLLPIVGSALLLGGAATAAIPSTRAAAGSAITFSHQVVVDMQRPGFEPDVKVDPNNGTIYSSVPFGFSTTESFIWSSLDHGNSYQLTPGGLPVGKPATCVGGGDTDLLVDPGSQLYFSDLQALTNLSQSTSANGGTTWSTNCAGAPNSPVDRMWLTAQGSLGAGNLNLYQDYDAVASASNGNNELVETVSHDGVTFQPVINATPGKNCTGAGLVNCVTDNEGISGNQVVDPTTGNLFISHTDPTSSGAFVSIGVVAPGTAPGTTQATWHESPILNGSLCPDPTCLTGAGAAEAVTGENFASIARDSAGYLYVAFAFAPVSGGVQTGPESIEVVHSNQPATMAVPSNTNLTWSAPVNISLSQPAGSAVGTNIFPWITAGSDGRVAVAWYHTDESSENGVFGAGGLNHAEWSVEMGQSLDAHDTSPVYTTAMVTEHPIKYGQICTNGLGCTTGGDRSLGDFLQVTPDTTGAAVVSYVDDTSADTANSENAGPVNISRQISGPSLYASVGSVPGVGSGPGVPVDSVTDPSGDAYFSAGGQRTPAGDNLDLLGASLTDGPNNTLVATINVKSLASLTVSPSVGGPDASWIIRWTQVTPGQTGNGHIYYAGMDNNGASSGVPSFFDGDTSCIPPPGNAADHCKYMTFPQTHGLAASNASYSATTGVITLKVPLADVGNPAPGTTLYSVTAFSATSTAPQSATTLFNLTDATTPFDHTIQPGTVLPEAPLTALLMATGLGVLGLSAVRRRRRRAAPG